jgi:hypothetical protein
MFKGLSVLTGKPAVRRVFVDGRRQFARKPGEKLVLRKAGLLLQGCQDIRPNRRRLDEIGYESVGSTPQEYIAHIDASIEKWRHVVTAGNIKPE